MLLRFCFILVFAFGFYTKQVAQVAYQVVKGRVIDQESRQSLPGVIVHIRGDRDSSMNQVTDAEGRFRFHRVPYGRWDFEFRFLGYSSFIVPDVIVGAGKEVVLDVELQERIMELQGVEISATEKSGTVGELTILSARQFRIEETERYPGSRQDPARMASNFAGVQGTNDTRNDIVVRGNSPSSTLWRLEDVDIPNPNHFAVPGSMGGPVSVLNNKYLGNSDFLTGAFPAMYGNANGGVFDVKMRNGNNERYEHTFQFGVLGTELTSEGPISKKSGATYLATYRYSTLDLLQGLNLKIGTDAIPRYQDAGFRINLPTKKAGTFSLWGIGGLSSIDIVVSELPFEDVLSNESYGDKNRDQYFDTKMGVLAAAHVIGVGKNAWMKTTLALSGQQVDANHDLILRDSQSSPLKPFPKILDYRFGESRLALHSFLHWKQNRKSSFRFGIMATQYRVNLYDQVKVIGVQDSLPNLVEALPWKIRADYRGDFMMFQPYLHWKYRFTELLTLSAGVYSQYSSLNQQAVVEPRVALKWQFREKQALSLGAGFQSQTQLTYLYFAIPDTIIRNGEKVFNTDRIRDNQKLNFTRSIQTVLGYDLTPGPAFRIKAEAYYQQLWDVPVYALSSGVSLINQGATFSRFFPLYSMENTGTGENYGIELTIEKFFSKNYFFLVSGSLYSSTYTGSNGIRYSSDFDGRFIVNALGGFEYPLGKEKKRSLSASTKVTYAGGRRYSPVDIAASAKIYDVVPLESQINSMQFPNYFRLDLRVAYKINNNRDKVVADGVIVKKRGRTHEFAVDLVNLLNIRNVLALSYAPDPQNPTADPLVKTYQLGFLPLVYYKIDF